MMSEKDTATDDAKILCSNLSNVASLLWHAYKSLPAPSSSVNWAGEQSSDMIHSR
jgi:hypothetical protein